MITGKRILLESISSVKETCPNTDGVILIVPDKGKRDKLVIVEFLVGIGIFLRSVACPVSALRSKFYIVFLFSVVNDCPF